MEKHLEKYLTIQQLCDTLQVSKSLVYKWVHYEYIPHLKLGTAVRFKESAVIQWLKAREKQGRSTLRVAIEV